MDKLDVILLMSVNPGFGGQSFIPQTLDKLRCLINDLNPQAVERAIERLRSNSEFVPLCVSALARARADWLYGINMTRLCYRFPVHPEGGRPISRGFPRWEYQGRGEALPVWSASAV